MKCPKCEQNIPEGSQYCPFCRSKLEGQENHIEDKEEDTTISEGEKYNICPKCNEHVLKTENICPKCGYNFTNKKSFEVPKHRPVSKLTTFKRNVIFSSNFEFNLKVCPNCNSELLHDDNFCYKCGFDVVNANKVVKIPKPFVSKLVEFRRKAIFSSNFEFNLKVCPNCNSELLHDDNFCYNCGEKVTDKKIEDIKKSVSVMGNDDSSKPKIVKTNYDSNFKIALTLYLEEFRKNPKKGFSKTIAKNYDTSVDNLKKQAIDDEFIELEPPLIVASKLKLTDIKEVLKRHGLKVSGKKNELIERLGENLSPEDLENTFKPENYQITDKGLEFINNNQYLIYLNKNSEIASIITPSDCIDLFEEREYSQEELYVTFINYINDNLVEELKKGKCENFEDYSNAIASILKDQGSLKDALIMRFNVFLFNINNYSKDLQPVPSETKIKSKDRNNLIDLIVKLNESPDEVMKIFAFSCHEFPFKRIISDEDSWKYFVKILQGEDLKKVSKEINEEYPNGY